MSTFTLGLDLGQANDYTALAILERVERTVGEQRVEEHVRWLDRLDLGTSYLAIVEHVCALLKRPPLAGAGNETTLVLDRTGVGRAVYDLFAQAYAQGELHAVRVVPISITAGDAVREDEDGSRGFHVPKRDLVAAVEVLGKAQPGMPPRLQFVPSLPLAEITKAELRNFQAKISLAGHDSYEAGPTGGGLWREAAHDDLVLSVALAAWYAEQAPKLLRIPLHDEPILGDGSPEAEKSLADSIREAQRDPFKWADTHNLW